MSSILDGLNERQLEVVTETMEQSALVLAGAGSGKTNALTKRIAYMLENGISPYNIMAITFTNKASVEMKTRVAKLIGEEEAKKLTLGTFHKICILMLKRFGDRIGINQKFKIADPSDQKEAMRTAMQNYHMDTAASHVNQNLAVVSNLKNELLSPNELFDKIQEGVYPEGYHTIFQVYTDYQKQLKRLNMLDFDDLLMYAVKLLEDSKETREFYQGRYHYISCDEYQDSNICQYKLIALLAGKEKPTQSEPNNVLVVGDENQGIYGFRGSDIGIILNFERDFPDAKVIKLEQNYRSTKTIVHAGNELIKHNTERKEKTLYTENKNGEKIRLVKHLTGEDEAEYIAQEIYNLVNFGDYDYKDIAVLYRTNFLSREIEQHLINKRVPYHIIGGTGFYDRLEVKDTIAYLKIVANPKDDIAMERILKITPGIGDTTIHTMNENARNMGMSLSEVFKVFKSNRKATQAGIELIRQLLQELYLIYKVSLTESRQDPVSKMMEIVWKRTGYIDKLKQKKTKESQSRLENLKELAGVAKRYETTTDIPTLDDFLDGVILQTTEDESDPGNNVNLLTVHASKGLEWPVVFVAGCNEGLFPHKISLEEGSIEEERRLMYVAVTRAEELLYLNSASKRSTYSGSQYMEQSRFLDEIPKETLMIL